MESNVKNPAAGNGKPDSRSRSKARFGAFGGVFTPCVLTILGVIMFMRTGFVTGYGGIWMAILILVISKSITTLTTLSLSAIATNLEMRGGGPYYMISRVLGPDFGGSIGITLFLAQAIGVAFYVIGFTEALFTVLDPLLAGFELGGTQASEIATSIHLPQIIASVVIIGLFALSFKGADVAIKAQYFVLAVLLLAVASFIVGGMLRFDSAQFAATRAPAFTESVGFWTVFAIFFPATTGITAGANMSGDLKEPARALPRGTLLAILFTAIVYAVQIVLMAGAVPGDTLRETPFEALKDMSVFSPLIMLGVFAATLSSALGSFLGAPRILQAMGKDRLMGIMVLFGKGSGKTDEPRRATVLTLLLAVGVVWLGDLNAVAGIISMFFLIAYGMINLSAFVESKSGNPSFRPTFRFFHWGAALAGAIGCVVAMMKINDTYALIALAVTGIIYFYLKKRDIKTSYGDAKRGYIFKSTRNNLLYLEESRAHPKNWRPMLVAVTDDPQKDADLLRVGGWLENQRGLYSVLHTAERPDDDLASRVRFRRDLREELRRILDTEEIVAFPEALVTHNIENGLADFLQSYSIGGVRPNTALVKMPPALEHAAREQFLERVGTIATFDLNLAVLKPGDLAPNKDTRQIDLWWRGEKNGSLMAMFAYLMTLGDTWSSADIRIMRVVRTDEGEREAAEHMGALRKHTRLPARVRVIRTDEHPLEVIASTSGPTADLVLLGMSATGAEEARRSLEALDPVLDQLPTTVLIWSNGEADVFA